MWLFVCFGSLRDRYGKKGGGVGWGGGEVGGWGREEGGGRGRWGGGGGGRGGGGGGVGEGGENVRIIRLPLMLKGGKPGRF